MAEIGAETGAETGGKGMTLAALIARIRDAIAERAGADASLEARLLVEHFAATRRIDALIDPGMEVDAIRVRAVEDAARRRAAGEPVHRIIGRKEFYGLRFRLSDATLEPRADTEALVDLALPLLRRRAEQGAGASLLDLGTGTGAIAIALLKQEPRAVATATDISADALAIAAGNADLNGVGERFDPLPSDWFGEVDGKFDLIVSNPPYIRSRDIEALAIEVRDHDPRAALDGGADGADCYRAIAAGAGGHLKPGGIVAVEIGYDQKAIVSAIFAARRFSLMAEARDLGGHDRALAFSQ